MPAAKQSKPPLQLFYSYSHEDEDFRNELELHLWGLKRQGLVSGWHDRQITAGAEWSQEISRNLETSHIILLLVSPNFIASEYSYDIEMKRAMERHEAGEARVIPIIIRNVDNWQAAPFGKLQAVPKGGKPVNKWSDKDEAWVDVARSIRLACHEMQDILEIQDVSPSLEERSFQPAHDSIKFSGKSIELLNPSDETLAPLNRINSVSTDVSRDQIAGVHGNRMPRDRAGTQDNIDEVLNVMDRASLEHGEDVETLRAGDMSISRIDLLLKKAILLQAEAEEAPLDTGITEEEKTALHRSKLEESYELLREANKLDPANTEVLLHMAQLLIQLTPDEPQDEQKILKRIRKLLSEPKNETEEFRLARATYLMAMTMRPPDVALLREARAIFERVEQTKWVEQCDELLKTSGALQPPPKPTKEDMGFGDLWQTVKGWQKIFSHPKTPAASTPANVNKPVEPPAQARERQPQQTPRQPPSTAQPPAPSQPLVPPVAQQTAAPPQSVPVAQPQFRPFGQWQLQVNDAISSIIYVNFIPNGVCFGTQFSPGAGHIQFNGRWGYNPYNRLLHLQGLINGVQPFVLNLIIHGPRNNGFYAVGSDGFGYFLTARAAQ